MLRDATEAERKACLPLVKQQAKIDRRSWTAITPQTFVRGRAEAVLLARIGTESGGAAVSKLLMRGRFGEIEPRAIVQMLVDRNPRWLSDLVARLAAMLMSSTDWKFNVLDVVEGLRRHLDLPRPETVGYARQIAEQLVTRRPGERHVPLVTVLRDDPSLRALVPLMFQSPDMGTIVDLGRTYVERGADRRWKHVPAPEGACWTGALRILTDEGLLERARLLDCVLDALLRGGRAKHVSGLVQFHEALEPRAVEVAARLRSYLPLLSDGTGRAPAAALAALRASDAEEPLGRETVAEAVTCALRRQEKGIARRAISWGVAAARRDDVPDELTLAVAEGLGHDNRDVQEASLEAVGRIAAGRHLAPQTVHRLSQLASGLSPSLERRASEILGSIGLGGALGRATVDAGDDRLLGRGTTADVRDLPLSRVVAPEVPPRLRSLAELAEAVAALVESADELTAERVLDGLAAWVGADPGAVREALAPVALRIESEWQTPFWRGGGSPVQALTLRASKAPDPVVRRFHALTRGRTARMLWEVPDGPAGLLRAGEVFARGAKGQATRLLAVPETTAGHVDPERVIHDLAARARDGAPVWPLDLEQAWLRLPRTFDDRRFVDDLAPLGSPAAQWLRDRVLEGPLTDPDVRSVRVNWPRPYSAHVAIDARWMVERGCGELAQHLTNGSIGRVPVPANRWSAVSVNAQRTGLALPSHREVTALALVPRLAYLESAGEGPVVDGVARLPLAQGPTGEATHLAIGLAAASSDAANRTAAVDALEGFVANGGLDFSAMGLACGRMLTQDPVKVGRVCGVLTDVARGSRQAASAVASLLVVALSTALPAGAGRRSGMQDLVGLAAETVAAARLRGRVDGLDAIADAPGSGRLVREARRLRSELAGT